MIQINPLQSYIDGGARAAITNPPSASLVFDLPGRAIWVKGVKLKGTDHTYTFSHDNYITLTNTPDQNNSESEDIKIGANITALKSVIDTTYSVVTSSLDGLAPKFSIANLADTSASTTYSFLGLLGSTLKWYSLPHRNIYVGITEVQSVSNTDPLKLVAGNGIDITWNTTDKCIEITNSKPDINHNTDFNVSLFLTSSNNDYRVLLKRNANDDEETGTVRYATTLLFNPSTKVLKVNGNQVVTFADIYIGATASTDGTAGLVPAATSINKDLFLKGDGTWATPDNSAVWLIEVDKASFALTQEWVDSGVGLSGLSPGPCLLYINYCGVHYTGIFVYSGTTINTDDEFPLHCSGYTQLDRGRIFAKIAAVLGVTKLMLAALKPETNIPLFTIKIKQIAIL